MTSPAEIYAEQFQVTEPKYYTRVPNIIDHLTYSVEKDGKIVKKRLSVYAKELYRVIRMIASDGGADWHTTEHLAEIIGCSVGSIVNAKEELLKPMDQLDGSPLIKEDRRSVMRDIGNGKKIKTTLCTRTIICIWSWNNAFMATIKHQNKFGRIPDSCGESGQPPDSCGESAPPGPHSCGEANKNPNNKSPLFKEQQPAAEAASVSSVVSLDMSNSSVLVSGNSSKSSDEKAKAFNWFMKIGCDIRSSTYFVESFTSDDIKNASMYVEKQIAKKKAKNDYIPNIIGYLRKTLENKWWIPKKA